MSLDVSITSPGVWLEIMRKEGVTLCEPAEPPSPPTAAFGLFYTFLPKICLCRAEINSSDLLLQPLEVTRTSMHTYFLMFPLNQPILPSSDWDPSPSWMATHPGELKGQGNKSETTPGSQWAG